MDITLKEVIIAFAIPIFCGTLSICAIKRLIKGKIEQFSFEYQVCGFGGMMVFVFGLFSAFEKLSYYLVQ